MDSFVKPKIHKSLHGKNLTSSQLDVYFSNTVDSDKLLHLHCCRSGPILANEFYLSRQELARNPNLKVLLGIQQPYAPVIKYLHYWITGLPKGLVLEILNRVSLNNETLFNGYTMNTNMLYELANNTFSSWGQLIHTFLDPIFEHFWGDFTQHGYDEESYQLLRSSRSLGQLISLEEFLTEVSLSITNKLLSHNKLPEIQIVRYQDIPKGHYQYKFINLSTWKMQSAARIKRYFAKRQSAFFEIKKKAKSFSGRSLKAREIEKIYMNLKKKRNRACFSVEFELDYLMDAVNSRINSHAITIEDIENLFTAIQKSYDLSISSFAPAKYESCLPYLDGRTMIEVCFDFASQNSLTIILQEFIRNDNYDQYFSLQQKFPHLAVGVSSCKVWDIESFPEFDCNLVLGLKYLLQ